jgi:hypothetical protein
MKIYKPAFFWFVVALAVRTAAAVALHLYSISAGFEGFYPLASGHDDRQYWKLAASLADGMKPVDLPHAYPLVLAFLFRCVGPSLVIGKALNIVAGSVTVALGVLITRDLSRHVATSWRKVFHPVNIAGLLLTFYPSAVFYSTQLVKDPILVLLGMWSVYIAVRILRERRFGLWALWVGSLAALYLFRPYAACVMGLSVLVFLTSFWRARLRTRVTVLLIALLTSASVPNLLGWGWFGSSYLAPLLDPEFVIQFRERAYSSGGSAVGIELNYLEPLSFISSYGYGLLTVLFGPFPWQIRSAVMYIALPESLVMLSLGIVASSRKSEPSAYQREQLLLLILAVLMSAAIALFSDNIGANTRLRLLPWSALLIYGAAKWDSRRKTSGYCT